MNVLIIRPSAPFIHPSSFNERTIPLGIGFLSSALKKIQVKVFFIDRYINCGDNLGREYLFKNNIDCVCLSLDSITIADGLSLLRRLNHFRKTKVWSGKIICGGPHVSYYPEDVDGLCDCVVVGEGDYSIVDAIFSNQKIIRSPRIKDLNSLPMPDYDLLLKKQYNANFVSDHAVNISTSRGCPYSCRYCSSAGIWGNYYAFLTADRIFEEICYLNRNYGYSNFVFREDNFIVNKKRIIELCELILKSKLQITWDCEARADSLLSQDLNSLMKAAGLNTVFVGMESADDDVLTAYNKKITRDIILKSIVSCEKNDINIFGSFVVGTHYDDKITMDTTRDFAKKYLNNYKINVFVGLPRSPIYNKCIDSMEYDYYDDETRTFYCKNYNEIVNEYVLLDGEQLFPWRSSPDLYIEDIENINNKICCDPIPENFVVLERDNTGKIYEIVGSGSVKFICLNNVVHLFSEDELEFLITEIEKNKISLLIRTVIKEFDMADDWQRGDLYIKNYPCKYLVTEFFVDKYSSMFNVEIKEVSQGFIDLYLMSC